MKQFILKNIVLVAILIVTLISSVFLIFFIWEKSETIKESMNDIEENVQKVEAINSARKPNSVEQSEKMIKADTEILNGKIIQTYRHFGRPYRPALLKLLKNIASPVELKTDLPLDPTLVARPKPKPETDEDSDGDEEAAETASLEPGVPSDEEKAVFNPASNLVILSFDEDTLRNKLADIYKDVHQETSDDTFVIPDTVQAERAQLFERLFDQIIEAPDVVDPARAEDFRKAAASKFAHAFALFREEVQALTLEDVTNPVAQELFLDALGLPRLMRQRDCKNYIDFLFEKYLASDVIPGLPPKENGPERERLVQDFIYGNISRLTTPVEGMVIPFIRNFQIKEDLFRRMKEAGISSLVSMGTGTFDGVPMDGDSDGPILVFTYKLGMTGSMQAIEAFINSLQSAYKTDRVYIIKDIKLSAPYEDLINANAIVAAHSEDRSASTTRTVVANRAAQSDDEDDEDEDDDDEEAAAKKAAALAASRIQYDLTDPHNPEYGKILIGENPDAIKCTIEVDYLLYRADNITPQ